MNTVTDIASLWLSQNARLITLDCPRQPELVAPFVVEQMTGRDSINALSWFDVDVVATVADLEMDACIGAALRLGLLQPDGTRRFWHGICTSAGVLGADGGLARYRLCIEPALAQLRWRRDSHVFQDADARAIIHELLADYPDINCAFDVTQTLAQRPICTQYRETDFAFFCRLLAAEGLNWRFEHDPDAHRLVIFDAQAATPGEDVLRFHGVRAADVDDAIDTWHACRTVQPNGVALSSWDPAQLLAPAAEHRSQLDAGDLPAMAIYDGSGERIASDQADAHGRVMLQAVEGANKIFMGTGAVRRLAAGHAFTLSQHDHYADGENGFKVLWVEHTARNNLKTGIQDAGARIDDATYRNRFACVRSTVALVPARTAAAHPCSALGTQTARVVGLPDAVATTNRDHQVRIQFAWQRGARPNPGGLDHPGGGNAPRDVTCGTWVRVAEALAGPNWGSQFIPRIGTEVIVAFIEGDIDRPVVVGQLHNGVAPPPLVDDALSGIHTANFDGQGGNQWQLDDTPDQLRIRLASSSANSGLHLGHLVQQEAGSVTRGTARGSGFELRTDAWTVLRGAQGVFLSTTARPAAGTGITSTQMDAQEAVALLNGARSLNDALAQAAVQQQALVSQPASLAQAELTGALDSHVQGKYDGPVNGQDAAKAQPGNRALDATQPVERFGVPAVVLDAAATMNWATPASTVVTAGQQVQWTTQSDMHIAAGATVSTVAGNAASLFSHSGGVRAIAANGPVSLQAHTDQLEILADKEVVVVSVSDAISIQAKAKIVLQAGQSSVTLEGGDITFACPGKFTVKGGQHVFDSGASGNTALSALPARVVTLPSLPGDPDNPVAHFDEQIIYKDMHSAPIAAMPVNVVNQANSDQEVIDVSPADGAIERLSTLGAEPLDYALRYARFKFN